MPKTEDEPLERVHIRLYESDLAWLRLHCSDTNGVNRAVRRVVRQAVKRMQGNLEHQEAQIGKPTK